MGKLLIDSSDWKSIASAITGQWPEKACRVDVAYLMGTLTERPTLRFLAKRWGCGMGRASRILRAMEQEYADAAALLDAIDAASKGPLPSVGDA